MRAYKGYRSTLIRAHGAKNLPDNVPARTMRSYDVEYIFKGFRDDNDIRRFTFECVREDRSATQITVDADMSLARKHEILMQELPLLCRTVIEKAPDTGEPQSLTLNETHMAEIQAIAVEKRQHRKPARKARVTEATGQAWRISPPLNFAKRVE